MKKIIFAALFLASIVSVNAQNDFLLTEQLFSRIATNPAGTGNSENVNAFYLGRLQWSGFTGAPVSNLLNVHFYSPKMSSGFGASFSYDESGIAYSDLNAKLVYAYHLDIDENNLLSLGLSAGVEDKRFDPTKHILEDDTERGEEDAIPLEAEGKTSFDADFGAEFSNSHLLIGLSARHLPGFFAETSTYNAVPQFYGYARGFIPVNTNLSLAPALLGMYIPSLSGDEKEEYVGELNLTSFIYHNYWAGLGCRFNTIEFSNSTATALVGFQWDWFRLGCAYELSLGELSNLSSSSFELMLSLDIPTKKKGNFWE